MSRLSKEANVRIWIGVICVIVGVILGGWWSPRASSEATNPATVVEQTEEQGQ